MISTRIVTSVEDIDLREIVLPMFVLYDHPKDFPDHVVVRLWDMDQPTNVALLFDTLAHAQRTMQRFTFLARDEEDDPVILGSYL